ncbi:MAG: hypothetical protein R3E89_01285 [Thiolinea sp.]
MQLETAALYVKPGVQDFLDWLGQQGVRILAISDMYLDSELIRSLLARLDVLSAFEQVYVSADPCLCKYSGRLYQQIAQQQGLAWTAPGCISVIIRSRTGVRPVQSVCKASGFMKKRRADTLSSSNWR